MNCPMRDMCEDYTPICQLDCEEYDNYQRQKINEIREAWKKAHPTLWRVYQALLILYLTFSFLCVLQVIGWIFKH